MVIGTSCMFSVRRCAVTVISWMVSDELSPASAACTRPVVLLPARIAAIAHDNFAFEFIMSSLQYYLCSKLSRICRRRQRKRSKLVADEILLERETGDHFIAACRDQTFFLELHALGPADLADVAFHAHDHSGLQNTLAAVRCEILCVRDERRLAMQTDTVHDRGVATFHEGGGNLPGEIRDLAVREARLDNVDVVLNLFVRELVNHFLIGRRPPWSAVKRAGKVGEVAEAPDHVGIERQQLAGPYAPAARV